MTYDEASQPLKFVPFVDSCGMLRILRYDITKNGSLSLGSKHVTEEQIAFTLTVGWVGNFGGCDLIYLSC